MNKIVKKEEAGTVVPMDEANSLLEVISRAASDQSFDADKMEKLLGMYERLSDRKAKIAFHSALAEMQPHLPIITEHGEIKHDRKLISRYALWEDINDAIRPILQEYGFALSFRVGRNDQSGVTITAILSHREGHSEETTLTLEADKSGSKNAVQAVGSSISYGQRYAAIALLNITTRGADDDGEKASSDRKRDYGPSEPVMGALNKTRLDAALRTFCGELDACDDEDSLITLLNGDMEYVFPRGSKTKEKVSVPDLLSQTQKDLPSWWWTKEGSDALGIHDRIEQRRRELRPDPDDPLTYRGNQ